ncbi:hypothetical protein ACH42_09640 [Endozoicomonas sp. (ex Bugula neritina AB1)]|nr:hypothetical protein ACH42_09640 [Endozoicomonas sp. (ex Bugula neritina AB1)]
MTQFLIGIGSNENARENCEQMIAALKERFGEIKVSQIVQTKAHGIDAPDYLNAVACIETDLDANALNQWCKMQEQRLGRDRNQQLCAADLDILLAVNDGEYVDPNQAKETYLRPLIAELMQ